MPVIAAIHGYCFGGGLQIALGADIRIAAPDSTLSVMESRWGLIPDMGITRALPRLVGIDVAKELTFTARRIDGTEAARLGVVTRTADDPHAAAQELAAEIAQRSPDAVRGAKRLFDESWTGDAGRDPGAGGADPAHADGLAEPAGGGDGRRVQAARRVHRPGLSRGATASYRFLTTWLLDAPRQQAWDVLADCESWPQWWRGVEAVDELDGGDERRVGSASG